MRENRTSGSEGGEAQTNELSLPLSLGFPRMVKCRSRFHAAIFRDSGFEEWQLKNQARPPS